MSVLVDWQIRELCEKGLLVPFDPRLINPGSIDVRLGRYILVETKQGKLKEVDLLDLPNHTYKMEAKEWLLAETEETFNFPNTVLGRFELKSSRAREGYEHLKAAWIDCGFHDSKLTLELINARRYACLPLYPGLKIGQIILYSCEEPEKSYKLSGRYNGDERVMASKG